jgi:hypothetical protein
MGFYMFWGNWHLVIFVPLTRASPQGEGVLINKKARLLPGIDGL